MTAIAIALLACFVQDVLSADVLCEEIVSRLDLVQSSGMDKIPNVVHVTAREYPAAVVASNTLYMEDGVRFIFYDDKQMDESAQKISMTLAKEQNLSGVYSALLSLRPMAFRADLWRYMILWYHGGIYMDDKLMLTDNIKTWLDRERDELVVIRDEMMSGKHHPDGEEIYWSGFIASRPRSSHIFKVIRHAVANIQKRYYTEVDGSGFDDHCLYITGPGAFSLGLADIQPSVPLVLLPRPTGDNDLWHLAKHDRTEYAFLHRLWRRQLSDNLTLVPGPAYYPENNIESDGTIFEHKHGSTKLISNAGVHAESGGGIYRILCDQRMVYCDESTAGIRLERDPCVIPSDQPT